MGSNPTCRDFAGKLDHTDTLGMHLKPHPIDNFQQQSRMRRHALCLLPLEEP